MSNPTSTTVQAWINGGASTPEATVTVARDPDTNLAALEITYHGVCDERHGGLNGTHHVPLLLDADSLDVLVNALIVVATSDQVPSLLSRP